MKNSIIVWFRLNPLEHNAYKLLDLREFLGNAASMDHTTLIALNLDITAKQNIMTHQPQRKCDECGKEAQAPMSSLPPE